MTVPNALDSHLFSLLHRRTKLKQTEVGCEYLKRCCETLAQENRRLHREVAELRALRTAPYPFYGHLPAAGFSTARVCPSCDDKVIAAHHSSITATSPAVPPPSPVSTLFARPHFGPFTIHPVLRRQPSPTSRGAVWNKAHVHNCRLHTVNM